LLAGATVMACAGPAAFFRDAGGVLGADEIPPVTTTFADAYPEDVNNVVPTGLVFRPMAELARSPRGGFYLAPGAYEMRAQSYCLHAGTHAPSTGDGYLGARLVGRRADMIEHILRNSDNHPEISRQDIQSLIWAIEARAKLSDLAPPYQRAAFALLTPAEMFTLNGAALGLIPPGLLEAQLASLPDPLRSALLARTELRRMFSQGNSTYAELERLALSSNAASHISRVVPSGRWFAHPAGYFVRYLPNGYAETRVQIYLPPRPAARTAATSPTTAPATRTATATAPAPASPFTLATWRSAAADHPAFPTAEEIFHSAAVWKALELDWKAAAADPRERSRWITWDARTGEFAVGPPSLGDAVTGDREVDPGPRPTDSGDKFVVAKYHTHPPNTAYPDIGPSVQDKFKASVMRIPELVRDRAPGGATDPLDFLVGPSRRGEETPDPTSATILPPPKEYLPQQEVAAPADTSQQRLGQSARPSP
jgi:hypothetical protein